MISEDVAHRRLILEGEAVPNEGNALQKHLSARLGGLGAKEVCGLFVHHLPARDERRRERRDDDAQKGDEEVERRRHVRHGHHDEVVVEHVVDEARQPHAHEVRPHAADARRNGRKEKVLKDDAEARIAERSEAGDLRAFLLHETGHVGQHDECRHEDERDHEDDADGDDLARIGIEGIDGIVVLEGDELDVLAEQLFEGGFLAFDEVVVLPAEGREHVAVLEGDVEVPSRQQLLVVSEAAQGQHGVDDEVLKARVLEHPAVGGNDVPREVVDAAHGVEGIERVRDVGNDRPLLLDIARLALHAERDGASQCPRRRHGDGLGVREKGLRGRGKFLAALLCKLAQDVGKVDGHLLPERHLRHRLARLDVRRHKLRRGVNFRETLALERGRHVDRPVVKVKKVEAHGLCPLFEGDVHGHARVDVLLPVALFDEGELLVGEAVPRALDDEIGDILIAVALREGAGDDLARRPDARDEPHADHHDEDDGQKAHDVLLEHPRQCFEIGLHITTRSPRWAWDVRS